MVFSGRVLFGLFFTAVGLCGLVLGVLGSLAPWYLNWDKDVSQPLAILGWYTFFPYLFVTCFLLHERYSNNNTNSNTTSASPTHASTHSTIPWSLVLRVILVLLYAGQQILLDWYLIILTDSLSILYFLIADVFVLGCHLSSKTRLERLGAYSYPIVMCVKLGQLLPVAEKTISQSIFGPSGLVVSLLMSIPITQLPVQISLLDSGRSLHDAMTYQMDAVFAHTLHVIDSLNLFFMAFDPLWTFTGAVQNLMIILTIISFLTANVYYLALFVKKHPAEQNNNNSSMSFAGGNSSMAGNLSMFSSRFEAMFTHDGVAGGGTQQQQQQNTSYDEDMLHYLIWLVFYIDLPLLTTRVVLWASHGVS
eukprot:PhF_6_TR6106/c0_g1_i4/m.8987